MDGKLSAVIYFRGAAIGNPACDLVIAYTYLSAKARASCTCLGTLESNI